MTLKEQVAQILEDIPETRNSDITLTVEIWRKYFPQRIMAVHPLYLDGAEREKGIAGIALRDLYDLPREDSIKRIRAQFNADGLFWPTDLKVALGRGIQEDKWREALDYPSREDTVIRTKKESYTENVQCKTCGGYMQPTLASNVLGCSNKKCEKVMV